MKYSLNQALAKVHENSEQVFKSPFRGDLGGLNLHMKFILFYLLFLSSVFTFTNAMNIPLENKKPIEVPTRPRAPMLIPLTVDLSTTELYLNFTSAVGIATITVTDSNDAIVHQELIDTDTNNELYIPIDSWESGDYSIEVSYGSITLTGSFGLD